MGVAMKRILIYICIAMMAVMAGCRTKTVYIPVRQTSVEVVTLRDTVINTRLAYYRDTITTPDTLSFLSNPYGYSWAESKDGMLHHSLSVWPDTTIPVRLQYIERWRIDSIPTPYPIEVPMEVKKPFSWWTIFRMRIGEITLLVCLAFVVFKINLRKSA